MTNVFVPKGPERFAHQKRGLRKMIETRGVTALLFDPGTGKTATALDYMSLLALKSPRGEARALVLAPLAAVDTWVSEAAEYVTDDVDLWAEALGGSIKQRGMALAARGGRPFSDTPKPRKDESEWSVGSSRAHALYARSALGTEAQMALADRSRLLICVVNLDTFASRAPATRGGTVTVADRMVEAVRRFDPDLIVVDESHRIKSPSSNTSKAVARLTEMCRRRVILTGTVMPHSPLDVFGQWRFLEPTAFGELLPDGVHRKRATYGNFKHRYAKLGGWMGKEVVGFKNLDSMQKVMARNAVVAKKADALDLPPTTDVTVPVNLSTAEAKAYAEMRTDLAAALESGSLASAPNRLTQMMRLRQITSGFIKDDLGDIEVLGTSKAKVISSIVHDNLAGEKRIVVFAHFRHEIDLLGQTLDKAGTEVLTVTGETSPEERALIRKRFGSDEDTRLVLVAQMRTMSLAVNELVTASHAIYASMSQQRDDYIQSRDRLDRQGQTRPVTFWHATVKGTVDDVILASHRDRTNLETAMLAHIRSEDDKDTVTL